MSGPISLPFHAFTIKASGLTNRIVTEISLTPAFDPDDPPVPPPTLIGTSALWDTGATGSVLTASVVKTLGLVPTGLTMINHAAGQSQCNTYLVNIYLPQKVGIVGVPVSECRDSSLFGAIIGMDIICRGDFVITNFNGHTWVSFRIPSMNAVDYVEESNKLVFSGVRRNAPCPCGKVNANGKPVKFKNCHGS